jgi:hypothetical protein
MRPGGPRYGHQPDARIASPASRMIRDRSGRGSSSPSSPGARSRDEAHRGGPSPAIYALGRQPGLKGDAIGLPTRRPQWEPSRHPNPRRFRSVTAPCPPASPAAVPSEDAIEGVEQPSILRSRASSRTGRRRPGREASIGLTLGPSGPLGIPAIGRAIRRPRGLRLDPRTALIVMPGLPSRTSRAAAGPTVNAPSRRRESVNDRPDRPLQAPVEGRVQAGIDGLGLGLARPAQT